MHISCLGRSVGATLHLVQMKRLEVCASKCYLCLNSSIVLLLINSLRCMMQAALALVNAAVKLVTHLASVPSTAAQFRTVLLDMPAEARQQLQVWRILILKATNTSQFEIVF
jgi:hypothetical protein